jgi:uncharacterized LabA/DUF88 family protein
MRVAIFFDGKNFYSGLKSAVGVVRLDFPRLAAWLVSRSGGDVLWAAHYYTGVETGDEAATASQVGLSSFLNALEMQPGFFVHRFPRKAERRTCPHCGEQIRFTQEKEVDTTMVADMLRLAAVDGFDIVVLVSGDADLAPAVENVRALGKKALVATWGLDPLARRLQGAAFDHVDLRAGLEEFRASTAPLSAGDAPAADSVRAAIPVSRSGRGSAPAEATTNADAATEVDAQQAADSAFLSELERAETKFAGGYVGANLFLTGWRSNVLDDSVEIRQRILNRLVDRGEVEAYYASDGSKAIRRSEPASSLHD